MYLNSLLVSSLVAASAALAAPQHLQKRTEPVTIDIKRRATPANTLRSLDEIIAKRNAEKSRLAKRHGRRYYGMDNNGEFEKRSSQATVAMSSLDDDNLYYTTIQIGTPPQSLDVQIDTGSSDLWVPVSTCQTCNTSQVQPEFDGSADTFDTSRSTSYVSLNTQASVPYGDGTEVSGTVGKETVTLAGFTVQNQVFIGAQEETGQFTTAGLMGFAFPVLASSNGTPWWLNALDQFSNPEFSFYFADWDGSLTDDIAPGGQFTLGGRNTSLFDGDPSFVNLASQDYWTVALNSIVVTSNTTLNLSGQDQSAIIDTGSTIITGPTDAVEAFYAAVPGAVRGETLDSRLAGEWALPCTTTVNAQFKFGSATVTLPAAALRQPVEELTVTGTNTQYCVGALVGASVSANTPAWIFGDSLLKGTYVIFRKGNSGDTPAVGFAPLKNVNYNGDGTATIGVGGDGIDGRIGNAGATGAIATGTQGGSSSQGTGTSTHTNGALGGFHVALSSVLFSSLIVAGALFA